MDLTIEVYSLVKLLPREESYGLSDQLRRASVSIPSNIAEGHGRISDKDFAHFLSMAKGSLHEVQTQLEITNRLGYISRERTFQTYGLITEINKMLNALIAYQLKSKD